jgi:hypothetical protein
LRRSIVIPSPPTPQELDSARSHKDAGYFFACGQWECGDLLTFCQCHLTQEWDKH